MFHNKGGPLFTRLYFLKNMRFFSKLFQGELEQLTVTSEASGGVSEQCSPTRVPFQSAKIKQNLIKIEEEEPDHGK